MQATVERTVKGDVLGEEAAVRSDKVEVALRPSVKVGALLLPGVIVAAQRSSLEATAGAVVTRRVPLRDEARAPSARRQQDNPVVAPDQVFVKMISGTSTATYDCDIAKSARFVYDEIVACVGLEGRLRLGSLHCNLDLDRTLEEQGVESCSTLEFVPAEFSGVLGGCGGEQLRKKGEAQQEEKRRPKKMRKTKASVFANAPESTKAVVKHLDQIPRSGRRELAKNGADLGKYGDAFGDLVAAPQLVVKNKQKEKSQDWAKLAYHVYLDELPKSTCTSQIAEGSFVTTECTTNDEHHGSAFDEVLDCAEKLFDKSYYPAESGVFPEGEYQPVWKSMSEFGYPEEYSVDLRERPRHRADAATGATSRRWPENSTPSSRRSYGDKDAHPKFDVHTGTNTSMGR